MTEQSLAFLVLVSFVVPLPLLIWLDRPRAKGGR